MSLLAVLALLSALGGPAGPDPVPPLLLSAEPVYLSSPACHPELARALGLTAEPIRSAPSGCDARPGPAAAILLPRLDASGVSRQLVPPAVPPARPRVRD